MRRTIHQRGVPISYNRNVKYLDNCSFGFPYFLHHYGDDRNKRYHGHGHTNSNSVWLVNIWVAVVRLWVGDDYHNAGYLDRINYTINVKLITMYVDIKTEGLCKWFRILWSIHDKLHLKQIFTTVTCSFILRVPWNTNTLESVCRQDWPNHSHRKRDKRVPAHDKNTNKITYT